MFDYAFALRRGMGAFGPKSPSAKQRQALSAQGYRLRDTDDRISREKKDGSDVAVVSGGTKRDAVKKPQGAPISYHGNSIISIIDECDRVLIS